MTERPFKMAFHDSEAQGPPEPEHLMYKTHASTRAIWWLVVYGALVFASLVGLIVSALPEVLATQPNTGNQAEWETGLLTLVLCFGGTGGLLHLLASLGRFVGERALQRSWLLFYYLRPPVGAVLGLFVYFILRMGVLSQGSETSAAAVNVYGVLTFAGLAGMFSRQAIDKFAEVFDMLFQKTQQDIGRQGAEQLFTDRSRDDASRPLSPGAPPPDSFKDEEPTKS